KRARDHDTTARATMRQAEAAVARALGSGGAKDTGAFLSGGTDSSTVLGLMSRLTGERVHAISIGFQERRYDELEYAERAARHFKARHHVRRVSPQGAPAGVPRFERQLCGAVRQYLGDRDLPLCPARPRVWTHPAARRRWRRRDL